MHHGEPLIWLLLPVELFDLSRLEYNHGAAAAALLAPAGLPPMLADAAAAAVLALGAPPPVLADAATTAVLAVAAPPPVFALLVSHCPRLPVSLFFAEQTRRAVLVREIMK
jgi:hypothetical protein